MLCIVMCIRLYKCTCIIPYLPNAVHLTYEVKYRLTIVTNIDGMIACMYRDVVGSTDSNIVIASYRVHYITAGVWGITYNGSGEVTCRRQQ